MDQFLAQPALIDGIKLERRLGSPVRGDMDGLGRGRLKLVDVGLERQALKDKSQQRQDGDPPPDGTRPENSAG